MCSMHTARVERHGDPMAFTHQRDRNMPRGADHHSWVGDAGSYENAHQRVKRARGSATAHKCVDCGQNARHWSYDHKDPDERSGTKGPYSLKVEHYEPRCVPCHKQMDVAIILATRPLCGRAIDPEDVRRLHAQGVRVTPMAKILGVDKQRLARKLDELGLPRFGPGNPRVVTTKIYREAS